MTGVVWADLARDVVLVQGVDAGAFLHSQLAQDVSVVAVGESSHSLLLEPTGHLVAIVRVIRHEEHLFTLDVEQGYGQLLIDRLKRFILRADVVLQLADWKVRAFRGEGAGELSFTTGYAVLAYWSGDQGVDVVGPSGSLPVAGEATQSSHIDMFRVDAHWPQLGTDVLVGDIPATTGVLEVSVSFTKGCYPGQELVERMDSRGTSAPVVVRCLSREGLAVGNRVQQDGKDVGTVTSVGFTRALARVSRQSTMGEPLR
jgi:folate-binding protein YgfZ